MATKAAYDGHGMTVSDKDAFVAELNHAFSVHPENLTWKEVGDRAGVAQSYLSALKNGDFSEKPGIDVIIGLEDALGVVPGTFSRHFGWVRYGAAGLAENSVRDDATLPQQWKDVILTLIESIRVELRNAEHQ